MTDPTHFNNDNEIDWEVRKLQAEVDAAKRVSARGATYWVTWITALAAVGELFLQYQNIVKTMPLRGRKEVVGFGSLGSGGRWEAATAAQPSWS